jgi:excisionase family DNA binding protein
MNNVETPTNLVIAYTIADACRAVGVGRTKMYELIADGLIEARQCHRRTLIPADGLRAFVASLPPAPIRKRAAAQVDVD